MTCKQDQERVEEEVLQAVDQWVEQQEQRCREEECNWWVLCTNKLVCWFVSVFGKVTIWVVTIVVRWVYRIVCTVVKVLFGLVLAPFDKAATLGEGVGDVVELEPNPITSGRTPRRRSSWRTRMG